ncbi:MAG: hypothetical protein IPK65_01255 [Gammaproteobacteria bacterium]|nr:hypothetical protein [Gammaproteobacteria bacterium]
MSSWPKYHVGRKPKYSKWVPEELSGLHEVEAKKLAKSSLEKNAYLSLLEALAGQVKTHLSDAKFIWETLKKHGYGDPLQFFYFVHLVGYEVPSWERRTRKEQLLHAKK